ncbi:pyruvate kinase [Haematococcus lacustris]|uniref:Pyruvate kinase n=1 Tax=Haematococcus lacustris TaxID=44745 RepID=A0A699ZMI5_HAELA|nr:pyruvate kinase [Haematococcus lacustris]
MVDTPRPTRAEATDVANAVLDGADGVLLGAETLRGKYAVDCVTTVCRIARSAEAVMETALYNEDEVAAQQFEVRALILKYACIPEHLS